MTRPLALDADGYFVTDNAGMAAVQAENNTEFNVELRMTASGSVRMGPMEMAGESVEELTMYFRAGDPVLFRGRISCISANASTSSQPT